MKILFPYVGDSVGGSHHSSLLLVKGLNDQNDVEAIAALHHGAGPLSEYLEGNSIPFLIAPVAPIAGSERIIKQIVKMFVAAFPLAMFLKKHSIDIVHVNDRRMHLTWLLAARVAGRKLVWHQRSAGNSRRFFLYTRLASCLVTISEYCRDSFSEDMAKETSVVSNPVIFEHVEVNRVSSRKMLVNELGLNKNTFFVSWVANWREQKRPLDFVDLAAAVSQRTHHPVAFLMFGDPRETIEYVVRERISELGLGGIVHVMGTRTPIEPYIRGCDVLTATAVREGLGRTLIEAMSVRTPVIATADGGHLEVVEDGVDGWLVPVGDTDAMADAVIEVMKNTDDVAERVNRAAIKVRNKYSLEAHVQSMMEIYYSILPSPNNRNH